MPTAWFISWRQRHSRSTSGQNLSIAIGFLISTVGFGKKNYFVWPLKIFTLFLGLLNLLNENSPMLLQTLFPLISGIGMGILFHAPYQVFGKAFKPSELATCTSAFFLVRFTGATVGLVCLFVFPFSDYNGDHSSGCRWSRFWCTDGLSNHLGNGDQPPFLISQLRDAQVNTTPQSPSRGFTHSVDFNPGPLALSEVMIHFWSSH